MSHRSAVPQQSWVDTFLQEAEDLLSEIDEAALAMSAGDASETIHRIFRAFHTIKGSSGMCGLTAVADFTHHIETLLDKVRSGEVAATPQLANLVLWCRDHVRRIIAAEQGGTPVTAGSSERLIAQLKEFAIANSAPAEPQGGNPHGQADAPAANGLEEANGPRDQSWEIIFRPHPGLFQSGGNPIPVIRDLRDLGECEVTIHTDGVPPLDQIEPSVCYLWWSVKLRARAGKPALDRDAIRDVFLFVEDSAELEIELTEAAEAERPKPMAPAESAQAAPALASGIGADARKAPDTAVAKALAKESTVRVPSARLDRLVNLVGELVMNQSRLTQIRPRSARPSSPTRCRRSSGWWRSCATTYLGSVCCPSNRSSAASAEWFTIFRRSWARKSN